MLQLFLVTFQKRIKIIAWHNHGMFNRTQTNFTDGKHGILLI